MAESQRQSGLSLVEMLVVLMVAGFALMLATQALGQWQRVQSRFAATTQAGRERQLIEAWWHTSVRGLQATEEAGLVGDISGFSGLTLQPVLQPAGTSASLRWSLQNTNGELSLRLEEAGQQLVLPLAGIDDARFVYLDPEGEVHPGWPPALGLQAPLPAAVGLDYHDTRSGTRKLWLAAIAGPAKPSTPPFEPESD